MANLADVGPDAFLQAEFAVLSPVIARVGIQLGDGAADGQGQVQKMPKEAGVVDIGGRWDHAQRDAVGCDDDMVLGSGLAPIGGIGSGQLATALGPDR